MTITRIRIWRGYRGAAFGNVYYPEGEYDVTFLPPGLVDVLVPDFAEDISPAAPSEPAPVDAPPKSKRRKTKATGETDA